MIWFIKISQKEEKKVDQAYKVEESSNKKTEKPR
jgi:hypothetical protein